MTMKIPLQAIEAMTDYLWDSEQSNFFDNCCEDDHVFAAAIKVAKWLRTQPNMDWDWAGSIKRIEQKIADARAEEDAA